MSQAEVEAARQLLGSQEDYRGMASVSNPFGDGKAAPRIIQAIEQYFHVGAVAAPRL